MYFSHHVLFQTNLPLKRTLSDLEAIRYSFERLLFCFPAFTLKSCVRKEVLLFRIKRNHKLR